MREFAVPSASTRLLHRRLRNVTGTRAHRVLARDVYWTVPFLNLYLDRCDSLAFENDPEGALCMAKLAPAIVERIPVVQNDPDSFPSEREKRSHLALSHAVLGSAYRRHGRYQEAVLSYEFAFALDEAPGHLSAPVRAQLYLRYGTLLAKKKDSAALRHIQHAWDLFREVADPLGEAEACLAAAGWHYSHDDCSEAADLLAQALVETVGRKDPRSRRVATSALCNYFFVIPHMHTGDTQRHVGIIRQVRSEISTLNLAELPIVRAKLDWAEGRLNFRGYLFRPAIRFLSKARTKLKRLHLLAEFAEASLELALALLLENEPIDQIEELRSETRRLLERHELDLDPHLRTVLDNWSPGLGPEGLRKIQQALAGEQRL